MAAYKAPDFNERTALARKAKEKALAKLRAKPVASEAELAERKATRLEREAADEEKRRLKRVQTQEAAAARQAESQAAAARLAEPARAPDRSEADRKAERDARYAARKARK